MQSTCADRLRCCAGEVAAAAQRLCDDASRAAPSAARNEWKQLECDMDGFP